jgi:hypothetical protein
MYLDPSKLSKFKLFPERYKFVAGSISPFHFVFLTGFDDSRKTFEAVPRPVLSCFPVSRFPFSFFLCVTGFGLASPPRFGMARLSLTRFARFR